MSVRLLYATSLSYPSRRANRIQVRAMAQALHHRLGDSFTLGLLRSDDTTIPGAISVGRSQRSFSLAWHYLRLIRTRHFTHVYCREDRLLVFIVLYARFTMTRARFLFEAHDARSDIFFRLACSLSSGVVCITEGIKQDLARAGVAERKILVAPDGVDPTLFDGLPEREVLRREFGFKPGERIVTYTGSLSYYHDWKGVDTLLDASKVATNDQLFELAGGEPWEIEPLRQAYPRVRFEGQIEHTRVPRLLRAADVLVLPNKKGSTVSERYTSPMKLFEYMASGTPIVASDLQSIREVLADDEAYFFAPGDPHALQRAVDTALSDPGAHERAERARRKVGRYTWDERARKVLAFMAAQDTSPTNTV